MSTIDICAKVRLGRGPAPSKELTVLSARTTWETDEELR